MIGSIRGNSDGQEYTSPDGHPEGTLIPPNKFDYGGREIKLFEQPGVGAQRL
jgi:hypothetical protein